MRKPTYRMLCNAIKNQLAGATSEDLLSMQAAQYAAEEYRLLARVELADRGFHIHDLGQSIELMAHAGATN